MKYRALDQLEDSRYYAIFPDIYQTKLPINGKNSAGFYRKRHNNMKTIVFSTKPRNCNSHYNDLVELK